MNEQTLEQLNRLKKGIRKDVASVARLFDVETPLSDHARSLKPEDVYPVHVERQKKFKNIVRKQLGQVFSEDELKQGNIDWESPWYINIVDHHGILSHPLLVSTNIIAGMDRLSTNNPKGMIVLSDSGVPMNNFFHKRGVRFDGTQLNLFPVKHRHGIAYAMPKKNDFFIVKKAKELGFDEKKLGFLQKIENIWNETGHNTRVTDYNSQVQRINYLMWKQLFSSDIQDKVPDVFYISNESVGTEMLINFLENKESVFYRLLCEKDIRDRFLKVFDGVTGCWDGDTRGTHFFWGLNDKFEAVKLYVEGDKLVSKKGDIIINFTPEDIIDALKNKKMYPSMFLVYGISVFHCGIRPLAGYGSVIYLSAMKEKWLEAMKNIYAEEAELISTISTTGFIGGPKTAFGVDEEGKFFDLSALDIIYRGGLSKDYIKELQKMPFNAVLTPALIDIYDSYVRPENKEEITITSDELMGDAFDWVKKLEN